MVFRRDITMMIIPPTKAITAPVPYTKRESTSTRRKQSEYKSHERCSQCRGPPEWEMTTDNNIANQRCDFAFKIVL